MRPFPKALWLGKRPLGLTWHSGFSHIDNRFLFPSFLFSTDLEAILSYPQTVPFLDLSPGFSIWFHLPAYVGTILFEGFNNV